MLQNRKSLLILPVLIGVGFWMAKSPKNSDVVMTPKSSPVALTAASTPSAQPIAQSFTAPTATAMSAPMAAPVQLPTRIAAHVKSIAQSLSRPDLALTPEQLDVSKITPFERQQLKAAVISPRVDGSTRRASLFLLTKMGPTAIRELGDIAITPTPAFTKSKDPHSTARVANDMEVSLRITALEALDKLSINSKDVLPLMQAAASSQTEKDLVLLARISISGMLSGKPGKLTRAMDAMMNEKNL